MDVFIDSFQNSINKITKQYFNKGNNNKNNIGNDKKQDSIDHLNKYSLCLIFLGFLGKMIILIIQFK